MFYKLLVFLSLAIISTSTLFFVYWGTQPTPYTINVSTNRLQIEAGDIINLLIETKQTGSRNPTCHVTREIYRINGEGTTLVNGGSRIVDGPSIILVPFPIPPFLNGIVSYDVVFAFYCTPYNRVFGPDIERSNFSIEVLTTP